jgi:hypothetical protein
MAERRRLEIVNSFRLTQVSESAAALEPPTPRNDAVCPGWAPGPLTITCVLTGFLAASSSFCMGQVSAPATAQENPGLLVRETVYNELHDHQQHGYWRYWVEAHGPSGTRIEEQVETVDGPVGRVLLRNGHRLDAEGEQVEQAKLEELRNSPAKQASKREAYQQDEERIARILALLPDAFVFQDEGTEKGVRHLKYAPNPKYAAHGIEAKVFHQLSGDVWIDTRVKRLRRLEGRLNDNVDFGFGVLGRVNKGGWFRMVRKPVSPDEWKTERLEMHMSGRALLFKSIAHETSEVRGGFEAVPPSMSMAQGLRVLEQSVAAREAAWDDGRISPANWRVERPGGR